MNISVFGLGYVGLSNALLLAQNESVVGYDVDSKRIQLLQKKKSPIDEPEFQDFLSKDLNVHFTDQFNEAVTHGELLIIATPTDYDDKSNCFDTSSVEMVIRRALEINPEALFLIKSTIPIGFIDSLKERFSTDHFIFSPEFLREGKSLYDNLFPTRIVIGERSQRGAEIAELFSRNAQIDNVPILLTNSREAESIKLFSNTYLAMRVAYFNELDSYAEQYGLDTRSIIEGIGLDKRIGNFYNNPSFGYGGYCLPKDSKQLLASYLEVPNDLIKAIVASNETRKNFIADQILEQKPEVVGIYRLTMKTNANNFRQSSVQHIVKRLQKEGIKVIIYEPSIEENKYMEAFVLNDLETFKKTVDMIVSNRMDNNLQDVLDKVYSRDIFGRD
ncbi:nucleotide sugar dehydrogenase [Enterococcus sp. DIV0170]|uniref:nucleotide sugar dehydrogenase n=1 Tax=Enterococcus sp. DIV0170 TaxID=2774642 RepID=UPI003F270C58